MLLLQKCTKGVFLTVLKSVLAFEKCAANIVQCFAGGGVWMRKAFIGFGNVVIECKNDSQFGPHRLLFH